MEIQGTPKGSLVHRFLTSGKEGYCNFCRAFVQKLEGHHITYSPEITIPLCHECHHKVHFFPQRLSDSEKFKLLIKRFCRKTVDDLIKGNKLTPLSLAQLVAPSRKAHIQKHILKENKVFKSKRLSELKLKSKKIR